MKLLTYKGVRICPFHQQMKGVTFVILFLPFLLGNVAYYWWYYEKLLEQPIVYGLIGAVLLIVPIIFVLLVQIKLYRDTVFFGRLDNLRVLATFLIQNNYYLTKKRENRDAIKLPKVYLKRDRYGLDVSFILQGNKFQDKFLNIAKDLEVMFDGDFMAKSFVKGYVTYTIILGSIAGRISVKEVEMTPQGLRLMQDVYWNFDEQPHLLVSGGTGGGKTVTLMSLIYGLAKIGWCDICDPKRSDFVGLKDIPVFQGRVFWEKEEMIQCLKDHVDFMNARYDEMTSRPDYEPGKRYSAYGLKPKFLIFDEWSAFIASLDSDYKAMSAVVECLTQIVQKGRQAGVFMILALQRPDGEFVKTALRDNFMKRLSVGHLEDSGYTMMFGDANRNKEFKKIDKINGKKVYGRGYIANGGEIAREFFSPYVPFSEGFSFLEAFRELPVLAFEGKEFSVFEQADGGIEEMIVVPVSFDDREEEYEMLEEVEAKEVVITLDVLAEEIDKKIKQIRDVIALIEKEEIRKFDKVDGKYQLTEEDAMILRSLFKAKETNGLTWKETIAVYFGRD